MMHLLCALAIAIAPAMAITGQTPPPLENPTKPQTPATKPQTPPAKPQTPPAKPQPPAIRPQARAAGVTLSVQVTDQSGNPLTDVSVRARGPVDRTGSTGEDGSIGFRSMRAGTYRVRFEREGFTTLERDVVIGTRAADVSVALTAAPPPPKPVPVPVEPAPPPPPSPRAVEPRSLSIADYLEKNLIGSEPVKTSMLGCAEGGTAVLLQIREPLNEQQHAEADEILYVVAGAGILRLRNQDLRMNPGHFALVPRGVSHSLRRDGRNPLIVLSVLAGPPCTDASPPVK